MSGDRAAAAAILGLMNLPRVGTVAIHRTLDTLREAGIAPGHLPECPAADLVELGLLSDAQADRFTSDEQHAWREGIVAHLESNDVRLLPVISEAYPRHLGDRAPPLLMARGNVELLHRHACGIAVAGARRASGIGLAITRSLVAAAVANRFTVVSGGASGTDATAHEVALARGGSTVVVLAEGILSSRARKLEPMVDAGGAVLVSTFLPHDGWQAWRAMERNRTILGLSSRLVVIEAGERGGTLAAGREALEAGIETWVLDVANPPETFAGNRLLLEMGAHPIPVLPRGEIAMPLGLFAAGGGW